MTVGKKKKRIVVYRSGGKKSSLIPFLIAGGVIVWAFVSKKSQAATVIPDTGIPIDTGTPYTDTPVTTPDNSGIKVYTPSTPVTSVITTTDPVKKQYLDSIKSRISTSAPIWPKLNAMSQLGLSYIWSLTQYINYSDRPDYYQAFSNMTDAELKNVWWYVGNYFAYGIPLLSATPVLSNGQYDNSNPGNPQLYAAMQQIHLKYGIF